MFTASPSSLSFTFLFYAMAFHWVSPPAGALKINVHGVHSSVPIPNGNNTGIGAVFRDTNGEMKFLTIGIIPGLSLIGNQLWAIYSPMRRDFREGFRHVIIETDNYKAYQVIKNFRNGAPAALYHLATKSTSFSTTTHGFVLYLSSMQPATEWQGMRPG